MTRRRFLRNSLCLTGASFLGCSRNVFGQQAIWDDSLSAQMGLNERGRKVLDRLKKQGLAELMPVIASPGGEFSHLGWPVATQLGNGEVVIAFLRASGGHTLAGTFVDDPYPSGRYITRSSNLSDWLPTDHFEQAARLGAPDCLHCIGAVRATPDDQRVVLVGSGVPRLVFLSDDGGKTWRKNEKGLAGLLRTAALCGPNLINHPVFGQVAAFGQEKAPTRRNYLIRSKDAGETWQQRVWVNSREARSVEPAVATWGPGHMVMISREYNENFALSPDGYYCHTQHVYRHTEGARFEKVTFTTEHTNIAGNAASGFDCHDTADVIFNPVSGRLECLQSHRRGGGQGETGKILEKNEADRRNTLNLWSIDPTDLLEGSAEWRFDGTLLDRAGYSRRAERDGLHPGGSVVDLKRGQQHIFVYAGWRRTPTSIYRLSRSLDTDRIRHAIQTA